MSWLDKVDKDIIITTGDGKRYRPLWKPGTMSVEYNIAEFDFPNVRGTKVTRGTAKGRRWPIELIFQGENHLDDAFDFQESAADKRAWKITHPLYGSLLVHPTSLNFDNTQYNASIITGTLLETIPDQNPKVAVNPSDKILQDQAALSQTFANGYTVNVKLNTPNLNRLLANSDTLYKTGKKVIKTTADAESYYNLFQKANTEINKVIAPVTTALNNTLQAIQAVQKLIEYPMGFALTVKDRIDLLRNQYLLVQSTLETIFDKNDKRGYENNQGVLISAMAAATVTDYNYTNAKQPLEVAAIIVDTYNAYVEDVDGIQSDNGGDEDSYIPDHNSMLSLNQLVNYTVANLLNIAVQSKRERSILCEDDTNLILLAHRFYGLEPDDSTLVTLAETNNIGLNEYLQIPKGRKIIYYV